MRAHVRQSNESPPGPSGAKGERTRKRIVQAGAIIFGRDGYSNTRMSDIARLAKLSQGALYRYFQNKDDVFRAVLSDLEEAVFSAARATVDVQEDPREALHSANYHYLETYWNYRETFRAFREVATYDERYQKLWQSMRVRFRDRFLYVLSNRFGVEIDRSTELRALAMQCCVEEFAYANFADKLGPGIEPSITITEAARTTSDIWYAAFPELVDRST